MRIRVPLIHSPVRAEISSGACSRSFTNSSVVKRRRVIFDGGLESYRQDFVMFICERDEADLHLRNRSYMLQCLIPEFLFVGTAKCGCDGNLLVGTAQQTHRTPSRSAVYQRTRYNFYRTTPDVEVKLPCARHAGVCGCEGVTPLTLNLGIR